MSQTLWVLLRTPLFTLSELGAQRGVELRSDMTSLELHKSCSGGRFYTGAKSRRLESLGSPGGPLSLLSLTIFSPT